MTIDRAAADALSSELLGVLHPILHRVSETRTLSAGKLGALRFLSEHGRATTSELAQAIRVTPQGMSLAVRELVQLQLVAREPDAADRRRTWITLTPQGQQSLQAETSAGSDWLAHAIVGSLTPEQLRTLQAAIPVLQQLGDAHHG